MDSDSERLKQIAKRLAYYEDKTGLSSEEILDRLYGMGCDDVVCFHRNLTREKRSGKQLKLKNIGILGASHISRGLAKMFAIRGVNVKIFDTGQEILDEFDDLLNRNIDWMIRKWELNKTEKKLILQHIKCSTQLEILKNVDLVFDTMRVDFEQRITIYGELEKLVGGDTPIGIDDETLYISKFAKETKYPERIIGVHFTYPSSRRNLLEF